MITVIATAGMVAEPLMGLTAFNAKIASGEGAHGPGRSRPATWPQDRMNTLGKIIRSGLTCRSPRDADREARVRCPGRT